MWEGFGSPYFIGMKGLSMNSVKRQQLASERIRKLETELEETRKKLEAAQTKNGQEDKRISELISTLDELKSNYLEKIQEVENIRDEYEQLSIDLRRFSSALRAKKRVKALDSYPKSC